MATDERSAHPAARATPDKPFVLNAPLDKRVRAIKDGQVVVDTKRAILFWTSWTYPHYAFPEEDCLRKDGLERLDGLPPDFVTIKWKDADRWLEEVHAKDPFKRLDVLQSSRHVRVEIDGTTVADTRRPVLLFETTLRTRTYIPLPDVRRDLLRPSDLTTDCPYKGTARYYHVQVGDRLAENVVWFYPTALLDVAQINGLLAFYDEKVDVWVDDVKQPR